MKTKNVLMQIFVLTPLTLLHSVIGMEILLFILSFAGIEIGGWESGIFVLDSYGSPSENFFVYPLIAIAIFVGISKLIIELKGHETQYSYWDSEFEFEGEYDEASHKIKNFKQVKGGWSMATRWGIVLMVMIISPATFLLQLISLIFMIISFFSKHILSFYGAVPYECCRLPKMQKIIHFLFGFVIVTKKQRSIILKKKN